MHNIILVSCFVFASLLSMGQNTVRSFHPLFRGVDYEASWSPTAEVVFISNRNGYFNVYTSDSTGANLNQITSHKATDDMPVFSPDSKQIAFVSDVNGNNEIYIINANGSNLRRITSHPGDDIHPFWSPDGSTILFNSSRNSKDLTDPDRYDIFLYELAPKKITSLTQGGINTYASFSKDGKLILFRRSINDKSQVVIMNNQGKEVHAITDGSSFDGWPSWGKTNDEIYFASDRSGTFQIYRLTISTNTSDQITNVEGRFTNPRLSPDNRVIMFTGRGKDEYNVNIFFKSIAQDNP